MAVGALLYPFLDIFFLIQAVRALIRQLLHFVCFVEITGILFVFHRIFLLQAVYNSLIYDIIIAHTIF